MKKYRIVKLESDGYASYCIQKKGLFWWEDLNFFGGYAHGLCPTHYYHTLDEARAAVKRFHAKKTVIDEYEDK